MDIVLLFPGQGSQKTGMGRELASAFTDARHVFEQVDDVLHAKLSTICFEGPDELLTATENAQPALLAHGAAVWAVVERELAGRVRAAAGHSLGEFTAYLAAGALTLTDAAPLVRRRGELMRECGERQPGAMAAILGLDDAGVERLCEQASDAGIVVPANYNSPEQCVVSGEVAAVERVVELAGAAGAKRAMRLKVSGAFHSPLMADAAPGLASALASCALGDPVWPVVSNVTAEPVGTAGDARRLLIEQLTSPVRWTGVMRALWNAAPGALFVEMGPGSVLTNLVRRIVPDADAMACGTPADVDKLLQRVS
ncbi:MAG TPA: ACP S-malonyltransferase [Gemmatimonadaceae bacterium]|nr:ACP S-malonyltransferase [Gemmatimonadaceae bacterium]